MDSTCPDRLDGLGALCHDAPTDCVARNALRTYPITFARARLVDPTVTRWYHCITRYVRRPFLLGEGPNDRESLDREAARSPTTQRSGTIGSCPEALQADSIEVGRPRRRRRIQTPVLFSSAWLSRQLSSCTLRELAVVFGIGHADSVRNLIRRVDRAVAESSKLRQDIAAIRDELLARGTDEPRRFSDCDIIPGLHS